MLFILFIGSILFYLFLKSATDKENKKELTSRLNNIVFKIKENPNLYSSLSIPGYVTIEKVDSEECYTPYFKDTILVDGYDNSYKQYKTLSTVSEINSELYHIKLYKSLIESNELIERITLIVTIIVILFIIIIYLLNRFFFKSVWYDFFQTIDKLKTFDVNNSTEIHFTSSDTAEFELLNSTLNRMIREIHKDYLNIKEFTGNISHEIQTPLTIIRMKCELLMQSKSLNKSQAALIRDIQKTNSRLSKLNTSLVLLTKIENKQFTQVEKISLDENIKNHLENFNSLIKVKGLELEYLKSNDISIEMDPMLADVFVVNLIKNAVTHNIENGKITIEINGNELKISNTGEKLDLSDKNIFDRYTSVSKKSGSLGLGLSLIKKICELYGFKIIYEFENNLHIFRLSLK